MSRFMMVRIVALAAPVMGLAFLIVWAAFTSWSDVRGLRHRLTAAEIESFGIASRFESNVLRLDATFRKARDSGRSADWEMFDGQKVHLDRWISVQLPKLQSSREKAVLGEIDQAYDAYLGETSAVRGAAARKSSSPGAGETRVEPRDALGRLLRLGGELAAAHAVATTEFIASAQKSLGVLQQVIAGAMLLLLVSVGWAGWAIYGSIVAPLRAQIVEMNELAERQEKLAALGVLAAGVAHEIRNPLTAIKARLFTQKKMLREGSSERESNDYIGKEIVRLERIVRDFLQFARPPEPELQRVSAGALLGEVREMLAQGLAESAIELRIDQQDEATLSIDPQQIKQVLINLVQNAAESIEGGGAIVLRCRRATMALAGRGQPVAILEVEDSGKGIPPEVRDRLFDPFFTTRKDGTGLGLSIAARIVEKHGGTIRYQTQVNRGTTFGIALPVEAEGA